MALELYPIVLSENSKEFELRIMLSPTVVKTEAVFEELLLNFMGRLRVTDCEVLSCALKMEVEVRSL